jgi:hypothetical protein
MVQLPAEIWGRIAFFACTDGGHMGAVLQQVSKLVAYGTTVQKNGVVPLLSAEKADLFWNYLQTAEPALQHVDSILIDAQGTSYDDFVWDNTSIALIPRILKYIGTSLRSFTLCAPILEGPLDNLVPALDLPCLETLTLKGHQFLPYIRAPRLITLHITINYTSAMVHDLVFVASLRSRAPLMQCITVVDPKFHFRSLEIYTRLIANLPLIQTDSETDVTVSKCYLEEPVPNFTLIGREYQSMLHRVRMMNKQCEEILNPLAEERSTSTHRFKLIIERFDNEPDTDGIQSLQWRSMFQRAVLRGTGTAEVYAEDYLPQIKS